MGEARHFKFDMQIDIHKYLRMHDRLPPKGMCSRSRDLFIFRAITDNNPETVQDRDIVSMED